MNKPIKKEQVKIGQSEIATFVKMRSDIFYSQKISKLLKHEGFGIYAYLCLNKNMLNNSTITSIRFISDAMKYSNLSRKEDTICNLLNELDQLGYIDLNIDIKNINRDTILEIEIKEFTKNFIKIYNDDYLLFERLNSKQFMVYMMLRAYYNKDKGYAYPTFVQISNFTKLSKKTVIKIIDELVYLDIINVDNEGWRKVNENFQKSNNMYSINFEGRKEFTRDIDSYEDTKKIMLKVQSIKNTSNKKTI